MKIQQAIETLLNHQDLDPDQMADILQQVLSGQITDSQIAGFLVALRAKGETIDEITAAAKILSTQSTPIPINPKNNLLDNPLIDIVGTGGDGANLFNISTACCFVLAACGLTIAKHGNRSVSSSTGSADVLEAYGINLNQTPEQIKDCLDKINLAFIFAQKFHPAMKFVAKARKELGVRTLFNLLGPLINPAKPKHQVIGVYSEKWLSPIASVCKNRGCKHSLIIHSKDGLDEFSIQDDTYVAELHNGVIKRYIINPEDLGIKKQSLDKLIVDSPQASLDLILETYEGQPGPARDIICLNAAAGLYAADKVDNLKDGIKLAQTVLDNGSALDKLNQYKTLTKRN